MFGDHVLVERYQHSTIRAAGKRMWSANPGLSDPATVERARRDTRLVLVKEHAEFELIRDFVGKLRRGKLIAEGFQTPMRPDSQRIRIATDLWDVLTPNFQTSSATGGGLTFEGVRITSAHFVEDAPSPTVDPYRTGAPGRPTSRGLVAAEFERRRDAGEVLDTLAAEAKALQKWLAKVHQTAPRMTDKTIKNVIRPAYRAHQTEGRKPMRKEP